MNASFLPIALALSQAVLSLAMICAVIRLLRGPRAQDRVLALEALYVDAMLLIVTIGMRTGTTLYFEIALAIAVVGFVSTAALARFLLRGEVIE